MALPDPSDWSDMRLEDLPENFLDDIPWDAAAADINQYFIEQGADDDNIHGSMQEDCSLPISNGEHLQQMDGPLNNNTPDDLLQPEYAVAATTPHTAQNDLPHEVMTPAAEAVEFTGFHDFAFRDNDMVFNSNVPKSHLESPAVSSRSGDTSRPATVERRLVSSARSDFAEFDPNPLPQPVFLSPPLDEGLHSDPVENADPVAEDMSSEEATSQSTTTPPNMQKVKKGGKHAHIPLEQDEAAKSYVYGGFTPSAQAARAFLYQGRKFKHGDKADDQQTCRQRIQHYTKRLFESLTLPWDGPREDFEDFQAEHYEKGQCNALIDINNRFCTVQECNWAKAQLIIVVNDLIELHEKGGIPKRLFWNSEKFNKLAPEADLICSERLELLISATKKNKLIGLALLNNDGVEDIILAPAASLKRRLDNAKTNAKRQEKIGYANEHMGSEDDELALKPRSQAKSRPKAQPKSKPARQKKRRSPDASEQEEPLSREPPKKKRRGPQKSSVSVADDQGSPSGEHGGISSVPMGTNPYTQPVPQSLASGFSDAPAIPDSAPRFHPQETTPGPYLHPNIAQQQPVLQAQQNGPHRSPQHYPQSSSQIGGSYTPAHEQHHTQGAPQAFTNQQPYGGDPTQRASYDGGSPMTSQGKSARKIDVGQAQDPNEQWDPSQGSHFEQMLRAVSRQHVQGVYQPAPQGNPRANYHRGSWAYEQAATDSNAPDVDYAAPQNDAGPLWQGL